MLHHILSIDPGTRNLAICRLSYDDHDGDKPSTIEEFLSRITLTNVGYSDLGSNHIPTANFRFKETVRVHWPWAVEGIEQLHVVIERQGSRSSPISYLCHAMQGFFIGMNYHGEPPYPTIYLDYPAADKFRGPWVAVLPREDADLVELESDDLKKRERDPVKRASVKCVERVMSYIQYSAETLGLDTIRREQRQHDMCDTLLQGISYIYKRFYQESKPSVTLPWPKYGEERLEKFEDVRTILAQPRDSRVGKRKTRTTTVVAAATRKRAKKADC